MDKLFSFCTYTDKQSSVADAADEIVTIFRMAGLQSAFARLLKRACEHCPVYYIYLAMVPLDASFVVNILDTENYESSPTKWRRPDGFLPLLFPERLREVVVCDDVDPSSEFRKFPDAPQPSLFARARSIVRYPLFQIGHSLVIINFWASIPKAFSPESVEHLQQLTQPLGLALFAALAGSTRKRQEEELSQTAFGLLNLCPNLELLRHDIQLAASADSTVLLLGETGVGKECAARALHELSARRSGPFISVNCGAIPESLIESLLFGHEKGAFTGASFTRAGYFEQAQGGTLFLDEIGEMTLSAQVHLLKVLENRTFHRLGGASICADVRVIAATHDDLPQKVRQGSFRADLWYRLAVLPLTIPPLRNRKGDIVGLVRHFIHKHRKKLGIEREITVPEKEITRLFTYDWPGNVRELEHVVERSLILNRDREDKDFRFDFGIPLSSSSESPAAATCALTEDLPTLEVLTERYIREVLRRTQGRLLGKNGAAEILGIHYSTLRRKLLSMGMTLPRAHDPAEHTADPEKSNKDGSEKRRS